MKVANFDFIKIRSYDIKKLLEHAGVVENLRADPSRVFVSTKDYNKIKACTLKQLKKDYPYLNRKKLNSALAFAMFDLGPNQNLGKYIKDGYMLVLDKPVQK